MNTKSYIDKISKDLAEEKLNIYEQVCQCTTQCIKLSDKPDIQYTLNNESNICNKISLDNMNSLVSRQIINKSLKFLIDSEYVKAIGPDNENHKYYITLNNTTILLTWDNIKSIRNKEIRELFWLFRKLVIDNLLKIIIDEQSKADPVIVSKPDSIHSITEICGPEDFKNMKIYSVGSTEMSSDYDITLFSSNNQALSIVIEDFQSRFMSIFGEHSSTVFDTNIYGKAYIIFDCSELCKINYRPIILEKCGYQKETFYYLKSLDNSKYKSTQVTWGLIKYLRDLKDSFGEKIHNKYFDFLKKNITNDEILDIALESLIYLNNTNNTYSDLIKSEEEFKNNYKDYSGLLFDNDYISIINFYGKETYFTRGAFLDTVINSQMCNGNLSKYMRDFKEKDNTKSDDIIIEQFINNLPIKLNEEDYIASILENCGFFFLNNDKTKYLKRVKVSVMLLSNINKKYLEILESIYFHDLSNISSDNYDYCNWVDSNDFNILKCEKYSMFQVIFKIIYRILKIYFSNIEYVDFPFYNIFIKGNVRSPTQKDIIPKYLSTDNSLYPSNINSIRNSINSINSINYSDSNIRNSVYTEPVKLVINPKISLAVSRSRASTLSTISKLRDKFYK